jgi:regulator of sigma D
MRNQSDPLKSQWSLVEGLLETWLQERKKLLVMYCNYGNNTDDDATGIHPRWADVKRFCQILVDYVSAGHFEVYDQLIREAETANDTSAVLAEKLYPKIHETTQIALDLNDKYATEEHWENHYQDFQHDLSRLGEALSNRFEMEDKLINDMHTSHETLLA